MKIRAGETLRYGIPVLDSEGVEVSLTSEWSARAQVRPHWTSERVLHEWTTEGAEPNATIDTVGNRVIIEAGAAETKTWQAWCTLSPMLDVWVIDPLGEPHKILADTLSVEPSYTRG